MSILQSSLILTNFNAFSIDKSFISCLICQSTCPLLNVNSLNKNFQNKLTVVLEDVIVSFVPVRHVNCTRIHYRLGLIKIKKAYQYQMPSMISPPKK